MKLFRHRYFLCLSSWPEFLFSGYAGIFSDFRGIVLLSRMHMQNSMDNTEESAKDLESKMDQFPAEPMDVRFNLILNDGSVIDCRAGKEVYESLFGARLEYVPKTLHNLNKGDYVVWEWQEIEPARLPNGLEGYMSGVELARRLYLTD